MTNDDVEADAKLSTVKDTGVEKLCDAACPEPHEVVPPYDYDQLSETCGTLPELLQLFRIKQFVEALDKAKVECPNHEEPPKRVDQGSTGQGDKKWCSFEDNSLTCEAGHYLYIKDAAYNRQRNQGCKPPDQTSSRHCDAHGISAKLSKECDQKQECSIPTSFHDSCPENPFTYIRVRYECVPA